MADRPIPYNDPFYFALPNPSHLGDVTVAEENIKRRFGIVGTVEVVRSELAFTLCSLSGLSRARESATEREAASA